MNALSFVISSLLNVVDVLFDLGSAVLRVMIRGVFAPDAKSYRSARYEAIPANHLLQQEIAINAADAPEARKVIALDPDQHLPLPLEQVSFDVVGPLDDGELRTRPERKFLLGVMRRDKLDETRSALSRGRKSLVEGFTHAPALHPNQVCVFTDAVGQRQRRVRRLGLTVGLAALVVCGGDAWRAWTSALERNMGEVTQQRLLAERQLRVASRQLESQQAIGSALDDDQTISLLAATERLQDWADTQQPETETSIIVIDRRSTTIRGRTYDAVGAELGLRRAFEGDAVGFVVESADRPAAFEARLHAVATRPPT